jgi:hypothetical protein
MWQSGKDDFFYDLPKGTSRPTSMGEVPKVLLSENCAVSGVPLDTHIFPVLRRGKPPKRLPEARKWGKCSSQRSR